jgi:mono/diheme cytochrome c family protein
MKSISFIFAMGLAVSLGGVALPATAAADAQLFEAKACSRCHSIVSVGVQKQLDPKTGRKRKGPDMSGLGLKGYDSGQLVKFVLLQAEKKSIYDGQMAEHRYKFRGSEDDLKKIVAYLQTLKSDIKVEDDGEDD